jgi:hypothetical protein
MFPVAQPSRLKEIEAMQTKRFPREKSEVLRLETADATTHPVSPSVSRISLVCAA